MQGAQRKQLGERQKPGEWVPESARLCLRNAEIPTAEEGKRESTLRISYASFLTFRHQGREAFYKK